MSSDSTGIKPPSTHPLSESSLTARKQSFLQKLKPKQWTPVQFETQGKAQRKHGRSSSFGGFVSRILPSHREEKGYTLRQRYGADSSEDPVDIVFGKLGSEKSNEHLSEAEMGDGGSTRKTRSVSPRRPLGATSQRLDHRAPPDLDMASKRDKPNEHHGERGLFQAGGRGQSDHGLVARGGPFRAITKEVDLTAEDLYQHGKEQNESQVPSLILEIPEVEIDKMTKTRKMFADKKARREQRRSLRESEDYLGVQGANPRNGLWDVSSGTSSSEPSQMSEETKKKLDEEAKNIEVQKRRYEEAKAKHQAELSRVQSLRDNKKQEKEKRKSMVLKMKQRRHGKWKLSEDGWRSVAEPELSPIVQSVVGSPARETAPGDRLFPMPSAADPTPYIDPSNIGPRDYFGHRNISSPLASKRSSAQSEIPITITTIPRKPVGSSVRRQKNSSSSTIIHTLSAADPIGNDNVVGDAPQDPPPKSYNEIPRVNEPFHTSTLGNSFLNSILPSQKFDSFLDSTLDSLEPENLLGREATATLSRSASTSQAEILPLLDQSLKATSPAKRYTSMKDLPPVTLRDPFAARIPLSSRPRISTIWAPPTIPRSPERQVSHITILTTTTTGSAHPQPLCAEVDGPRYQTRDSPAKHPSLQRKTSQIPLRTTSLQNSKPRTAPSKESQANAADIATSSEHLLMQTKQRTARLCHTTSPGGDRVIMKSTPISISTSQPTHQMVLPAARIAAALTAFQNLRHRAAIKKGGGGKDSLTPPKIRTPHVEMGNASPTRTVDGDHGGIEDPFRTKLENASKARSDAGWMDSLVVWHPSPDRDTGKALVGETMELACLSRSVRRGGASPAGTPTSDKKAKAGTGRVLPARGIGESLVGGGGSPGAVHGAKALRKQIGNAVAVPKTENRMRRLLGAKGGASDKRAWPKPALSPQHAAVLQDMSRVVCGILQTACLVVGPFLDPESDVRKRWARRRCTGKDVVLCISALAFLGALLLVVLLVLRAVAVAVQALRLVWSVLRVLRYFGAALV